MKIYRGSVGSAEAAASRHLGSKRSDLTYFYFAQISKYSYYLPQFSNAIGLKSPREPSCGSVADPSADPHPSWVFSYVPSPPLAPSIPRLTPLLQSKTLDVVTLFHKPSLQPSVRALTLLKQVSAQATAGATEDQATDHAPQRRLRHDWELNVTEDPPTGDQARTILEYVGEKRAGELVEGARNAAEALKMLKEERGRFKPPVVSNRVRG